MGHNPAVTTLLLTRLPGTKTCPGTTSLPSVVTGRRVPSRDPPWATASSRPRLSPLELKVFLGGGQHFPAAACLTAGGFSPRRRQKRYQLSCVPCVLRPGPPATTQLDLTRGTVPPNRRYAMPVFGVFCFIKWRFNKTKSCNSSLIDVPWRAYGRLPYPVDAQGTIRPLLFSCLHFICGRL